jgi:type II secretory pathway component PulF
MESLGEIIRPAVILIAGAVFIVMIVALLLPVYDLVKHAVTAQTL